MVKDIKSSTVFLVSDKINKDGIKIGKYSFLPGAPTEIPKDIAQDIMNRKKQFNFKETTEGGGK